VTQSQDVQLRVLFICRHFTFSIHFSQEAFTVHVARSVFSSELIWNLSHFTSRTTVGPNMEPHWKWPNDNSYPCIAWTGKGAEVLSLHSERTTEKNCYRLMHSVWRRRVHKPICMARPSIILLCNVLLYT